MSLAIKYETAEDANLRLKNSVVLYKGDPVLIKNVQHGEGKDDILRVRIQELPLKLDNAPKPFDPAAAEEEKRKYISSKYFDIAPFKMGYVNSPGGVFYCARVPGRIQKQGLCAENFTAKVVATGVQVFFPMFCQCKETLEMVKGIYPTFDRALALLSDKVTAVAFSRDFCIVRDEVIPHLVYLYHKNVKVGYWSRDELSIGKKFACLKETLNEMHIKVGVC